MPRSLLLRGSRSSGRKAAKAASPGDFFFPRQTVGFGPEKQQPGIWMRTRLSQAWKKASWVKLLISNFESIDIEDINVFHRAGNKAEGNMLDIRCKSFIK